MKTSLSNVIAIDPLILNTLQKSKNKIGFESLNWAELKNEKLLESASIEIGEAMNELIGKVQSVLMDPHQGLAVLDIPSIENTDQLTDMWMGSLIALIISRRIYKVHLDPNTNLPFTIYNASTSGEKLLRENGIKYYSPEKNLGFHTDGIVTGKSLSSPKFVSIYNVYLGYKKPGNFHWVPFALWDQFKNWQKQLLDKRFLLEITPITYKEADAKLKVTGHGQFKVSLMHKHHNDVIPFFNGEVISCVDDEKFDMREVENMLTSLSKNSMRISVPLKSRRLFILNNWYGAHARDIFAEPIEGVKYTRSFFRMMSAEMAGV
jgi:hypothetical protein